MKIVRRLILLSLVIILLFAGRYVYQMLPVLSGYSAKTACSCVFVGERSPESVIIDELGSFPQSLGRIRVDYSDASVTASVWGLAERKAIYRRGLGCTPVVGLPEESIESQSITTPPLLSYDQDTMMWPTGNIILDTHPSGINMLKVSQTIDEAFTETDPDMPVNTRAVLVVYKGQLIAERYAPGFDRNQRQLGWSMCKSITNALTGILVKQGKLDIHDQGVLAEWSDPDDPRYTITLDDLLKMSSGLDWFESYYTVSPVTRMLYRQADMGTFSASFKAKTEPGIEWEYSSGTTNIMMRKIRDVTGPDYHQFPYRALFHKIGMTSALIELDASGGFVGSSFGWAAPRDWARFGLLYLNDGVWEGERILPEGWVQYSSTPLEYAPGGCYGAQFWHITDESPGVPSDTYFANGFEGQRVAIIPSKDLVIVRLGQTHFGNFDFNALLGGISNAVE